jgi:hypothetical protein
LLTLVDFSSKQRRWAEPVATFATFAPRAGGLVTQGDVLREESTGRWIKVQRPVQQFLLVRAEYIPAVHHDQFP